MLKTNLFSNLSAHIRSQQSPQNYSEQRSLLPLPEFTTGDCECDCGGTCGCGELPKPFKIKRPGALTRKAKRAGMSVDEFAQAHKDDPGLTGKQARFYLNILKN